MVLPHTYAATLLLMILSMLCWGSWANTFKLTGKWRFELFYYDYALGVLLAAIVAALTFGSLGFDGFSFLDDLLHASKRHIVWGFAGGVVFNLANMLLVAAISVAGLAVAFPIAIGLALVIGVVWNYVQAPHGNAMVLFFGTAIIAAAIIVDALAYRGYALSKAETIAKTGRSKSTRMQVSMKGVVLSLASGVLMGSFFPLVEMGKGGELGLGPYSIGFVFAMGVFLSTFIFNLFFMNLPVEGEPVEILDYVKGTLRQHLLGITGGLIWGAGAIANFVAASAESAPAQGAAVDPASAAIVGPAVSYGIGQGATMVSALWGLLVWKEFAGANSKVRFLIAVMLALFVVGLVMVSMAPVVGQ